jgi:outer membrane receptor for ferrienterochelin and colicin
LNINLLYNTLDDFIVEAPTPDGADEYFTNREEELNYTGVETLLTWQPIDALSLRLSASYLESDTDDDLMLPYLAKWNGSLNLEYQINADHAIGLSLVHSGNRPDSNQFENDDSDAFYTPSLYAHGRISQDISYSAGIDNVFDEALFDPAGEFNLQHNTVRNEREFWLRLKWTIDSL